MGTLHPRHQGFREGLAGFEARGGLGRAEDRQSGGGEAVGKSFFERGFGADDGEVDGFAAGEVEQAGDVGGGDAARSARAPRRR